ncbi:MULTISPECIES: DUF4124 domain-containing protein [Pseudoalteromonas]|uniref:DUF4124 domain-containing protein n=1 Tax=Pseudoalteromonas TaxID=53246 RepID=UPI0007B04254|nr:DUF4124 domain-containing protein [Pseudoalteromonas luteoviolacea]KZN42725.1 hypothetical protein N483_10110 [Pseudoalteromonas luteoviolacea NCIMB 1944]MCG7549764.1 DUF4124 domain-containing protein [Pseudoalteromonas sp. Of7M-16]
MVSRLWLVIILCLASHAAYADKKVYRWKDENGNWVYSDTPRKGAAEVKINTHFLTMPATDTSVLGNSSTQQTATEYKATIIAPNHKQTLRDNTGSVYVSGQITPRFAKDFTVQLYLDGKPTGPKQHTITFALRNVPRGEHSIQLMVFNSKGKVVTKSDETIFYLHKARANQ